VFASLARRILADMSVRFYVNSPIVDHVVLQGAEARHATLVCRLHPGDVVCLFNGDGREYSAEITALSRNRVDLAVRNLAAPARELPFRLEIACPLPKGDRGQFLIEKLTELGVSTYVPLRTRRSVIHPSESRQEKLQRYVIEASKQCGRNVLMQIEPTVSLDALLAKPRTSEFRWIAHPAGQPFRAGIRPGDTQIVMGPEGGLTDEEVHQAQGAGWQVVSLGPRILRVETAALALAARLSLNVQPEHQGVPCNGGNS
jgi:16S rRNA (uracil1498-N3)-methyltransferase